MSVRSLGYRLGQWASLVLPYRGAVWLAERIADWRYACCRDDREAVQRNVALILGASSEETSPAVREVFRNFGRYLVEFVRAHGPCQPALTVEGREHLTHALQVGRGAIILSAHLGNWELGGIVLRRMGFQVSAVVLPHRDRGANTFFDHQRRRCGIGVIPLGPHSTKACLAQLKAGGLLGIVADREFGASSIEVTLLGRQVQVPRGPAVLSLRTGTPIVPTFLVWSEPGHVQLSMEPPIWPTSGSSPASRVAMLAQAYVSVIERYIRALPTQWLMFQPLGASLESGRDVVMQEAKEPAAESFTPPLRAGFSQLSGDRSWNR